jgi:hypothetical protein
LGVVAYDFGEENICAWSNAALHHVVLATSAADAQAQSGRNSFRQRLRAIRRFAITPLVRTKKLIETGIPTPASA